MSDGSPANLLTVWADLLLDVLARSGVRDVVASPGSRSTPFLLAAVRHPSLTIHSVIDERAAGFYALGLARVHGTPPLLLCTSGTAPAHYYPAVIEASEAALPLIVLSADRPLELIGTGAPQTTDQAHLYGSHARTCAELGEPNPSTPALRALARTAARAVQVALGPAPGPVQLEARARQPLEPVEPTTDAERQLAAHARSIAEGLRRSVQPAPFGWDGSTRAHLEHALAHAERPVLVAGPLGLDAPREAVFAFARRCALPLLAEASSQLRFAPRAGIVTGDAFDFYVDRLAPDLVIEIGHTPTSGTYLRWLDAGLARQRFVLGGSRFRDPSGTATAVVLGDLESILESVDARAMPRDDALRALEAQAWDAIDPVVAEWGEAAAMRCVCRSLPPGALLGLGNSLPIRHADRFVRGGLSDVRVVHQRGVNGIDGWIAGMAGAACASGAPTVAVIGDVAFAHDVGALGLASRARGPLVYVVLDNAGGRLFDQLPIAMSDVDMELFTTPPCLDLRAVCAAFDVAFAQAASVGELGAALRCALATEGTTVIRVVVPPAGAAAQLRAIRRSLEAS